MSKINTIRLLTFLVCLHLPLCYAMPPKRPLGFELLEGARLAESDGEDSGDEGAAAAHPIYALAEDDEEEDDEFVAGTAFPALPVIIITPADPPTIIITPAETEPAFNGILQRFLLTVRTYLDQERDDLTPYVPRSLRANIAGIRRLMTAVLADDLTTARRLLEEGVDPRVPDFEDSAGRVPLHAATTTGMVDLLLRHGADIEQPDYDGMTPLHVAVMLFRFGHVEDFGGYDRHYDVVRHLLDHGADINARNIHGHRPLDFAALEDLPRNILDMLTPPNPQAGAATGQGFGLGFGSAEDSGSLDSLSSMGSLHGGERRGGEREGAAE
ncbi:MAG: ankyrin repeat domain-containing protein [Deltaproteobacteria bacterium]|nr:ankyrin repeat domain-containing protein [Deltaproteobacteria bacterium]